MPRSRMAAKSRTKRRRHLFEQLEDRRLLAVISWDGDTNNDGVAGGIGDNANWYTASNWDLGRVPAENDDVKIGAEFAGSTVEVVNFGSSRNLVNSVDSDAILRIAEKGRLEIASESRVAGLILEGRSNDYGPILGGNGSAKELIVDGDLTWKSMSIDRMRLEIGGNLEIATDEAKSLQFSSIFVDGSDSTWSGGDVGIVGSSITNRGTFTFTSNADILPPGPFQSGATIVNHSGATMIMDTLVESNDHKKLFGKFTNNGVLHVREGILELGNCCDAVTHQGQFLVSPDSELVVDGKPTFDESSSIQTDVASTLTFRSNGPTKINGDFQVSGTVNISDGGSIQFAQDVEIPTLVFQGSEIRGPGLITVTDDFHWMKGSMASGAKVVSTGAATLGDIATGGGLNFSGGEFVNQGEATWVAGPFAFGFGTLRNQGIFHEATNASIGVSPFTGGTIINQGTWNVLHTAGVITNTRQLPFQNHGRFDLGSSNVDYLEFIQFDGETALDGGSLTVRGGGRFIDLIDGAIVGEGTLFGNVRQQGGTIAPNGQLTIDGNLTATGGTLAVDVRGAPDDGDDDSAGTNYDQLAVNGSYAVTGEISLGVAPGFMPTLDDSYQVAMSDSRSGSFATIDGVLIDATKAWQVSYVSDGVLITVVEATEEIIAGALRSDFNRGVLATRNQMVDWFNAGDRGLPGSDQRLGNLYSVNLEANVASLLPTLDTPVTTLEDLEAELVSAGYQVDAIAGDGNGELLQVSVSERVVEFSTIIPAAVDSFVGLSKIPQGVQLAGELTYDATTKLTNLELGIDTAGFYVGPSSIFELTAEGGGEVNQQDFPLNAGALTLDLAGTVSVPSASPVSVSLSPDERLRLKDYDESPELIFDVSSSGESTLSITHTLDPTGLTYDGTWSFFQQLDGEQIEPVEVSLPNIAYPNSDDLLTAGVGLLAGMFDTLLGPEAAANFNAISLPLINDTLPADAAPELFGINPADFGASDASWISSLFGAVRGFLEPNDPAAGGQGLFRSEGDFTVGTNTVRYQRSIDGSGVKVGVISTGADGFVYSQLTGDLPVSLPTFPSDLATRSESDSFGGRGTAMMEVIHDLAPGAELAFASANDTDSLLAAVAWMTEVQDVDVIVSDVVDYTESVFTAGPFTRYLAEQIEEHDVLFIQAAGNDGQRAYRDTLSLINVAEAGNATRRLHRFGGSDEVPITTIPVTLAPQSVARFVLQTSQNFLAPSAVVAMQVDELPTDVEINRLGFPIGQTNGRIPNVALNIDSLTLANHSTAEVTVDVAIELINGQLPGQEIEFQLVTLGEAQLQSTRGPQLFGSARLQDVLVVGAVENETPEVASPYSSVGDASLRLPDVAAPSGVDTSGFGFTFGSAFRGTSSAAAHAAAVAALLNQLAPTTTQDEIREAIKASATAIGSGPEDPRSGRGVIDAAAAAQLLAGAPSNTNDPPMDQSGGLQQYLDLLPQWLQVSVLSDQQIENLLSGTDATIVDLMQLRVDLDGDTLGRFDAGFPFNFDGIGSFDEFEISGRVNIEATPDILLQVGWNEDGLYLDAENSRVAASLKGTGEARGYAFETFGVGAGGTVSASPYLDLIQIDRDNNSRIHLDEIQDLADDLADGQFSVVLPQIDRVDADVYGDLIFGFLDYVDVDPNLPNQKHGGDPFIVRGRAELSIGLSDNEQGWQFGEFGLANPDVDGDGENDYTLGVLAENSLQFGQSIINAIEVPDFVKDLLGEFRFSNESLRRDPLVRPRGMLPETMDEAAEGTLARERIDAHLLSALLDAIASGEEIDADSVRTAATPELAAWFQGAPTTSGSAGAEGEAAAPDSIVARLNVLEGFYTTHNPAETDAFESSLNAAITSYLQWLDAVAVNGLEPEDVVDATTRLNVRNGLIRALDHAIHRSHTEAIQLHLADPPAPLNHLVVDGVVAERGVFDRAIEAVRWAQTAEYLELATVNNGLTVAQALDELVINVVVESATLSVKGEDGAHDTNGVISGDGDPNEDNRIAQLNIQGGWQIKLPPDGEAPDINAHTSYDRFSETIRDASGNLVVTMAGAGNRNFIAGDPLASAYDPIQTSFNPLNDYLGINRLEQLATYLNRQDRPDLLPITQGELDVNGSLTTSVRLGEGDTFAQVQYEVGLPLIGLINDKTNVIQGRPELNVFVGTLSEDVLTRDRATVRQGQAVSVEARVRRGNGPLTDGTLSFALEGPGFLDTASLQTTLVVPRTPLDGFAKTIFEAPAVGELTEVTIAATLTDNGRLYTDSARIEIVRNDVPQMEVVSYFLGIPQQPIATDVRAQLSELLQETGGEITEAVSEAARVPLIQWFDDSVYPLVITARDLAENAGESDDAYIAASDAARIAGSNYVEWFGVANSLLDPAALFGSLPVVTQDLLDAVATLSENRIVDFQATAETEGLSSLYEALSWAFSGSTVLDLPFDFQPATPWVDRLEVLDRSGIAIEWLVPPDSPADATPGPQITGPQITGAQITGSQITGSQITGSQITGSQITGGSDEASLKVAARIVIRDGQQLTPVMQDGLPAPVEINLIPQGLSSATVTTPLPSTTAEQLSQGQQRRAFLGSRYAPTQFEETETYVVESASLLEATAERGPSEDVLRVIVDAGIPGISLDNRIAELKDDPQISLTAAPNTAVDDSAQSKNVHLDFGERAVVQVNLSRTGIPIRDADVNFTLVGGGAIDVDSVDTGQLGLATIEYTPPALSPGDANIGVAVIGVSHLEDGVIYHDRLLISYQRSPDDQGDPDPPNGTDDAVRAKALLAFAVVDNTDPNGEPNEAFSFFDDVSFEQTAKQIMRDWFIGISLDDIQGDDPGSVLSRLNAVTENNGFPLQTSWQSDPAHRDPEYRQALEEALSNWFEWQASVGVLGFTIEEVLGAQQAGAFQQSQQLVASALTHAVDRVNDRCAARATDYRNQRATSSGSFEDEQQLNEFLGRLILEGNAAFQYFNVAQALQLFQGIETFDSNPRFDQLVGDFCFAVEFDQEMTFLEGAPDNAVLNVKAGLRVDGVEELLVPPSTAPLLVTVTPLGPAQIATDFQRANDEGVFETTINFGDDESPQVLVDVVFGFDETINITPSRKLRLDAVTYGSQIVTLGTSPDIVLKASLDSERDSAFRETDIESINGEYVYVEAELTRGRIPLAGKPVFVQSLGGGSVRDGFKETDANGKISFIFVPPSGEIDNDLKVGRTQIAVAYQEDGETFTDSIFIDYTTDDLNLRDGLRIRRAYSEAQTIAATEAGRHLAIVGRSNVIGSTNTGPDEDLLESIQRKWLTSRLTDPEEPLGLLQRIQDAVDKPERALSVAIEYFRFEEQNAVYGIDDRFLDQEDPNKDEFELREKVIGLLRAAIDAYVNEALEETNVAKAREALALTTQVAGSTLFEEFPEYSLESIKERLGYEIQIREPEVHGTADNAIVGATIHLLLKTPNDGPQVIAEAGGLTVDAVSYGFNDKSQRQRNFRGGTYTQKVSIVTGDPNLEVVLRAFDEYDDTDLVLASKRGDYTSEAGVRLPIDQDVIPAPLPDGTASSNETFPPLDTTITVAPGDSFILETRVLQGKSPVPIAYPNLAHQFDPDSSVSITSMESIAPGRVRVTVGDEPGTLSGVLASTGSDGASFTAEFSQAKVIPQLTQFRVIVSDSIPEGEVNEETNRSTSIGGGLINNSATVAAANQLSVPLAAANEESQLGNGFGLDAIQLPFAGPENFEDFSRSLGNWFSNSLDLLNIVELDSVMDWFSSGLPAQPEDIIRVKLDLNGMAAELPPTVFAADFTGLLPDGFSGDVSLDRPELSGQIVFGIDTSNSPFYVLTQPDDLTSSFTSVDDLLAGGGEQRTLVGREVTEIGAQFGISATFGADELIDGILEDFRAEGHATSKITIDFSDVAVEQRKLRFHELGELTNVKVDFDGDPVESFQAIIEGKASIPGVNDTQTDNALASLEAAGAIYKVPSDVDADAPWQFQLRTADLFELPEDLFNRLATATVNRSETPEIENDDVYEDNDTWQRVTGEHLANLGTIHNQLTLGGQDPNSVEPDVAEDVLALTDAADWYRFETTDAGDATSFVQIDFDQRRGDLDLALYRLLEETDLTTDADDQSADSDLELVRVDGLNFADQARITMLGQPAGTYFVHVFDDRGGQNPFYTLTIDPPGRLGAGLEVEIGDFSIRDAALEINVDSNLELAGHLGGRLVMSVDDGNQVGRQSNETVELTFQAEIDTVAGDDQDNGGFRASVSAEIGGQVLSILDLQDVEGNSIASPTEAAWSIDIDHQTGGYLIFDYEAADNFKFAGLNAAFGRWELGAVTPDSNDGQWRVPEGADFRLPADTAADSTQHRVTLVLQGNQVELWASNPGETNDQRLLSHAYDENLFGRLGIGAPNGRASFDHAELMVERVATPDVTLGSDAVNSPAATNSLPTFATTLFNDSFLDQFDNKWRIEAGIWKSDNGRFVANSSAIKLGDSLLIDSARLTGLLDVQFSDVDIRQIPPLVTSVPVDASDDGYVFASIELSDLNALLFQVADSESGTPLYPNDPDSPEGLVAIRDGGIRLTPAGAVLSAGSASAGIRDVLFVTLNDAKIDLTDDPNVPLLQTGNIEIRIPSLSEDADLVTISGPNIGPLDDDDDPTTDAVYPGLFGLSKPTLSEPIPDFLLLQDEVTIDVNASAIQKKLDVGGVFPFNFDRVGLRFNDVGNTDGQIMNLSDFDLLVSGQIDFDNAIFSSLDGVFTPIFAIDQPDPAPLSDQQRLLSSPDAYQLTCDRGISIFSDDPSIDLSGIDGLPFDERTLCRNGYISTELSLGSLVGNDGPLLKELGPIYVGFKDLNVYEALEITGLVRLGGFQNGEFVPDIVGGIHVVDDPPGGTTNTIATVTVGGRYEGPIVTNPVTNERQTSLIIDLVAESDTGLGEVLGGTIEDAAVNLRGTFINTFTDDSPFNLTGSFEVRAFEAENVCVELNDYVTLCGSAVVAPAAGPDQPVFVIKEGSLALGSELGPVAGLEIEAGGFGIGRGGELFALNAGYFIPDPEAPDDRSRDLASFPNGAYIALARDAKGGLFGLPDWVPFDVRQIGLSFNGVADPRDPGAPTSPLIVGPPTFDEIQELGSEPEGIRRLGEELVNELVIPITDPDNLSLVISGGLEGTEVIPLTGNVERLKVNLGHLAGCVAIAAENVTDGAALEYVPGYIFDSACEFPIENLNGVKVGIEPVELGPLTVAGTLGLGVFTFDRTPDRPQNVFYGSINGEVAVNGIGLGVEVILTEYGPVLARFKGGAPIPIGTLVGALGGPIGAAAGTASGFILTGLEGGLIFDADPLKVVEEPTDIFTVSELRTPLKIKTSDIENAIRELAFANPTFSQIISEVTDPNSPLTEPLDYPEVLADLLTTGELGDLPLRFTWDDGFRAVVSGTLTNQYVAAQLGLGVTLGFNVGYDFGALLRSDNTLPDPLPPGWPVHAPANASENPDDAPIPAMDSEGFALDREGNRLDRNGNAVAQGITDGLATFDELFGFQLYGFADVEVLGLKLVGAGMLMDFSDPINPVFNIAAGLPAAPSLLSLVLPSQGVIGAQIDTSGYLEGQLLATIAFLETVERDFLDNGDDGSTSSFFYDVLQQMQVSAADGVPSPLEMFAHQREADRRVSTIEGIDLSDSTDPDYDERFDPRKTGYTPNLEDPNNPQRDLWRLILRRDGEDVIQEEITRQLIIDRIFDTSQTRLLPNPSDLDFGDVDLLSLSQITTVFTQEFLLVAQSLLVDDASAEALTSGLAFWGPIETQMTGLRDQVLAGIDDEDERTRFLDAFGVSLNAARVSAAFAAQITRTTFGGYQGAARELSEVFDPKLRISGELRPTFLGFPMGPPDQSVDVTVSKNELAVQGTFSTLSQVFNMAFLPALVKDSTQIEAYFPFDNLLRDLYEASVPRIDPLADDWRVGIESSMNLFGLQIGNSQGILFPAGATQFLDGTPEQPGKIQKFYGPEHLGTDDEELYDNNPTTLDPNKILVRASEIDESFDNYGRLVDNGGLLVDGRLTLPRFLTDPIAFWDDLQNDPDLRQQLSEFNCDGLGLYECITNHPIETFGVLGNVPTILGDAVTVEEVAQLQLFIPNFIDDVIESLSSPTRAQLDQLMRDPRSTSETIANFISEQVGSAFPAAGSALTNAYLIGTWGQLSDPYASVPFDRTLPPYDEQGVPLTNYTLGFDATDGFNDGDDLDAINETLLTQGVQITSTANELSDTSGLEPVRLIADPENPNNRWLSVGTDPNDADLILNFDSPVSVVAVTFVDNAQETLGPVSLRGFSQNTTAREANSLTSLQSVSGAEPSTLVIRAPGLRALQIDGGSSTLLIDSIEVNPPSYPTTSKLLGIDIGGARINGGFTEEGLDVDVVGTFLGVADTRFELSVNDSVLNQLDPNRSKEDPLLRDPIHPSAIRVGAEVVIGSLPPACNTSVTSSNAGNQAGELTERLSELFFHLGLGEEIEQGGELVRQAYDWLDLDQVDAGACVRAFSPGFDRDSTDDLKRDGGIAVHANFDVANFLDTSFDFTVTPSNSLPIPNVVAEGRVQRLMIPGLEIDTDNLVFGLSHQEMEVNGQLQGVLSATLGGSIDFFGYQFEITDPTTQGPFVATLGHENSPLRIYTDGFAGSIPLIPPRSSFSSPSFNIDGEFTLEFDTRPNGTDNPDGPFARIVTNGTLDLRVPGGFSIDGSASIRVDGGGVHFEDVTGINTLFDQTTALDQTLSFNGSFSLEPDPQFGLVLDPSSINLSAQNTFAAGFGPGEIQGEFNIFVDSTGLHGDFSGFGQILGVDYGTAQEPAVAGTFNSNGCLTLSEPLDVSFELPGTDASCVAAREAAVALTVSSWDNVEGDPVGVEATDDDTVIIELTVSMLVLNANGPITVSVPWMTESGSALANADYAPVSDGELIFSTDGPITESELLEKTINIAIVRDRIFETPEEFSVLLDEANISGTKGDETIDVFVADGKGTVRIQNDDDPESLLTPLPNDTVVFFDFDSPNSFDGQRRRPYLNTNSVSSSIGLTLVDRFETSEIGSSTGDIVVGPGLPVPVDQEGTIVTREAGSSPMFSGALPDSYIEFTVDPIDGGWLPQGIQFYSADRGALPDWELTWDLDHFETPIFSSADEMATSSTLQISPQWETTWTRHQSRYGEQPNIDTDGPGRPVPVGEGSSLICSESPITFRLQRPSNDSVDWPIDNLAIVGQHYPSGCKTLLSDIPSVQEIEQSFEQLNNRILGSVEVLGAGNMTISISPDPNDFGSTPGSVIDVQISETYLNSTVIEMNSNGTSASAEQAIPINVTTDSDVLFVDYSGMPNYFGTTTIGGTATIGFAFDGLADGASIIGESTDTFPGLITSSAPFGEDVTLSMNGPINTLQISGGWQSGLLQAANANQVSILNGDFGANVSIVDGLQDFGVTGGNIISDQFDVGGDIGAFNADAVDGVGGSINTNLTVGGNIHELSANGGSVAGSIAAQDVGTIGASIDDQSGTGGNVEANVDVNSLANLISVGGAITSNLTTHDATASELNVAATPVDLFGGVIDSPNSFHIAGGVESIIANQINLRVTAGGRIETIAAIDTPERPSTLQGRFTGASFGRVSAEKNGTADFELTVTDEAWKRNGLPGFNEIRIPYGSRDTLTDNIHLLPTVQTGAVILVGQPTDTDEDGVPDEIEDGAPGNGDGNADGIPDRLQQNVASLISDVGDLYLTVTSPSNLRDVKLATIPALITPDSQQFMFDAIELFVDTQEPGQRVPIEWILHDNQDLTALFQYDNQSSNRDSDYFLFVNDVETGTGVTEIGRGKTVANYVDGTRGDLDGDLNREVQIVALLALADGVPAVNPVSRTDVNNDRNTTALDALRVINQLARSSGDPDAPIPANSQAFLDVNNDGQVTALDALQVINALARQNQADGEGLSDDEEDLIFSDQSFIDDLRWIGLNA